jgi:hypothetical protein
MEKEGPHQSLSLRHWTNAEQVRGHLYRPFISRLHWSTGLLSSALQWYGGLGWRHLYYEQGILHVLLIKHLRTPGPLHSLLHVCLQWYQVIAGVPFSPLSCPDIPMPYLDSVWLDSTRVFLSHSSAQLVIPEIPLPQLQRENDACTMDRFIEQQLPAPMLK